MRFFLLMSVSILGSFAESLTETTQSKERMRIFLAFVNMCMPRDQTGIHNKHVQNFFWGQQMACVHAQECRKWDRHRGRCSGENWLYFVPTGLENIRMVPICFWAIISVSYAMESICNI